MKQLLPDVRDVTPEDLYDLYDDPGPYLRAGFVLSVDGAVVVDGTSEGLQSPADKAVFRALRTVADAVIVGAGTARDEDYGPVRHGASAAAWRAAHDRDPETPLVVVSRSGGLPADARFRDGPLIVAVPDGVEVPGVEVLRADGPEQVVAGLHERGFTRLLCEGGPTLITTMAQAGLVTELCLTTSTLAVGESKHMLGDIGRPQDLQLRSLVHDEPGVLLARWAVAR